jgi:two-component system response regulator HydG
MPESTVLLISGDATLIRSIQGVIDSISQLRLEVQSEVCDALPSLRAGDHPLVLIHAADDEKHAEVARVLRLLSSLKRPAATLVVAEEHRSELGLLLLRQGAADYLSRPLDLSRLSYLVDMLTVRTRYSAQGEAATQEIVRQLGDQEPFFYLATAAMGPLMEQVRLVAPQQTTLLLGGETGTGKTRLARLIHELSPRRQHPFLSVHCGSLAENLIESELFGHVRGAFTGADRDRAGKFAAAGQGTLLLDEIDSLPPNLQTKFLRAVEERVFEPVGGNMSFPVKARIITASNQSLEKEVATGRFRSDLYYRLSVVGFHLPPLRDRASIIPHIAGHFVSEYSLRNGRQVHGIAEEAVEALRSYEWPGNIRELRNVIERAVALCPGPEIRVADLPDTIIAGSRSLAPIRMIRVDSGFTSDGLKLSDAKGETEAAWILKALRKHGNNRVRAAAELGISRMTLYNKMHRYGLMGTA